MEKVIALIKDFFKKGDWNYQFDKTLNIFSSGVNMNSVLGNLRLFVALRDDSYVVYAALSSTPDKKNYGKVAEYLHRANYGMRNGNFEFDYTDGEVRYKTFVNFGGIALSPDIVAESILAPIFMFDHYGKGLLRVMMGDKEPAEMIRIVEAGGEASSDGAGK